MGEVDLGLLDEMVAGLLAAAGEVSSTTRASYERRWRMWRAFVEAYPTVVALPADPVHVAAFVVARWSAGVSEAAIAANLSAVGWFHQRAGAAGVTQQARAVLRALTKANSSDGATAVRSPSPTPQPSAPPTPSPACSATSNTAQEHPCDPTHPCSPQPGAAAHPTSR